MPLGIAHDTPTPSFSSRKSQCSRRAWCSWTTNRGALVSLRGTLAPGSGVFLKSRLASYSASFLATYQRLGSGLRQPHLQADSRCADVARFERALGGEALELLWRVGTALE